MSESKIYATGRRKRSSARVYMSDGKGKITVNNESLEDLELRLHVLSTNLEVLDDALNLNRRLEVPLEAVLDQHERHVTFGLDLDFGPGGASVVE